MASGHKTGGRQKGTPNKTTALLKDAILKAAQDAGDGDLSAYLTKQAKENPGSFMTLLGKVLPLQVTGDGGGPVRVQAIDLSHLSDDDLDLLERIFGPLATADTHETVQ
jgi:hypothetical protein